MNSIMYTYRAALKKEVLLLPGNKQVSGSMPMPVASYWKQYVLERLLKLHKSGAIKLEQVDYIDLDGAAEKVAFVDPFATELSWIGIDSSTCSTKDWAFLHILVVLIKEGCLKSNGDVVSPERPIYLNGMEVVPLSQVEYVNDTRYVRDKMGSNAMHASGRAPWTPIGLDLFKRDVDYRKFTSMVVTNAKELHLRDLHHFEEEEQFPPGLERGLHLPCALYARLTQYRSLRPQSHTMEIGTTTDPQCGEFYSLERLEDVAIENPRGAMGFPKLTHMTKKGEEYTKSKNYKDELVEAYKLMNQLTGSVLPRRVLENLAFPLQVGVRFQGYGRGIIIYSRRWMLVSSVIGQPLTLALEKESWYASGDMMDRIKSSRDLLKGKIVFITDGDDFVFIFQDGKFKGLALSGDYSSMEAGITPRDFEYLLQYILLRVKSQLDKVSDKQLANMLTNIFTADGSVSLVTAFGLFRREQDYGVNSGSPFTHNVEGIINAKNLSELRLLMPKTVEAVVEALTKMGREMRANAQYVCQDGTTLIAKRLSDGTVKGSYGSVVRAINSTVVTEGQWEIPENLTTSEWVDARTLSIGINIYNNPSYYIWLEVLKAAEYRFESDTKKVMAHALQLAEKRRGTAQRKKYVTEKNQTLEKYLMSQVYKDITSL